jgi:hypothetical protein
MAKKTWHKTVSGTRVYVVEAPASEGYWAAAATRLGHVRNTGPRRWYAELYRTKEHTVLDSLQGAKAWVEMADKLA